jgi:hypothetical protein
MREAPSEITLLYVIVLGLLFGLVLPRLSPVRQFVVFLIVVGGGVV